MLEGYGEYKDINTSWLHSIPKNWVSVKIGELFEERKVKVSDKKYAPLTVGKMGVVPQLSTVAKSNDSDNRKLVKSGDYVINSRSDRKGSSGLSSLDGSVSLINIVLTPREGNGKYYHYLLRSYYWIEEYYRNGRGIVADLWTTRFSEMKSIVLPIPPRPEQDQIVRYLDWKVSMFNKYINAKKNQIELLKERKQTIINQAVTKGLNMNVPIKDSGIEWLGKIPAHWNILYLSQVAEEQYISNKEVHNQNLLSLSYGNIVNKDINTTEGLLPASFDTYQIVNPGNVILRLTDLQNDWKSLRVGLATQTGIITSAYVCLFCKDIILPEYLYLLLHSFDIRKVFYGMGGGVRQSIGYKEIRKLLLLIPPQAEQQRIANYCKDIILEIGNNINYIEKTINLLQEYRICLISDVVTGKVNVQNIKVPDFVNAEWQAYCYSEEDV